MEKIKKNEKKMFYLWWVDKKTGKHFCAGRAFYHEKRGDYSLLVNLLQRTSASDIGEQIYLKPLNSTNGKTYYRVEKLFLKGNQKQRFCIGEGVQTNDGDIQIDIEPLTTTDKKLLLTLPSIPEEMEALSA